MIPFKSAKQLQYHIKLEPQTFRACYHLLFMLLGADFVTINCWHFNCLNAKRELHKNHNQPQHWLSKSFGILIKWNFKWQPALFVMMLTRVIHLLMLVSIQYISLCCEIHQIKFDKLKRTMPTSFTCIKSLFITIAIFLHSPTINNNIIYNMFAINRDSIHNGMVCFEFVWNNNLNASCSVLKMVHFVLMDLHFVVTMISLALNAGMHRFTQHSAILHISPRKLGTMNFLFLSSPTENKTTSSSS